MFAPANYILGFYDQTLVPRRVRWSVSWVSSSLLVWVLVIGASLSASARAQEHEQTRAVPVREAVAPTVSVPMSGAKRSAQSLAERFWVPREELSEAERAQVAEYCEGAYRRPIAIAAPTNRLRSDWPLLDIARAGSSGEPIYAEAERGEMTLDESATLTGEVRIVQGERRLRTQAAHVDLKTRKVRIDSDLTLEDEGAILAGQRAVADMDSKTAAVEDAEFLLFAADMRGTAATIEQDDEGSKVMNRGGFTRCEPGNRNWRFTSRTLTVAQDDPFATARGAVLRVRDVPIFYTPYIRFPVTDERQSGWLFPNIAYSSEDGLDLSVPYYWNLAPHYDATIIPRYFSKRGLGGEAEFRHLSSWGLSSLNAAVLPKDDLFDGTYDREDFEELFPGEQFRPKDRWLLGMQHQGGFSDWLQNGGRFTTLIDYTAASDRDYFRDLGSDLGVASRIELERRGEIAYNRGGFDARLWAQRFQRIDELGGIDPYERVPELDLAYRGENFVRGLPVNWSLASKISRFDRDTSTVSGLNAVTGDRVHVEPRLQVPMAWSFGFLNLGAGYRLTRYDLDASGANLAASYDESPERDIPFGTIDGGLFFDRPLQMFGAKLIQTLEPRVFYLRQGFEEQSAIPLFDATPLTFTYSQLFRENRFSGIDRIGDANQVSTGVTTRFIDQYNGREYLRASVGQIWYFEDRRVAVGSPQEQDRQSSSAIAAEVAANIGRGWTAQGTLIWDPHDNVVDEGSVFLQFRPDARRILNVGYRNHVLADVEQTDLSVYWPISQHFSLIGRWNYDLVSGRTIEAFGGLEYNDCCMQVRVMARRFIDSPSAPQIATVEADRGIFVQFVFKGLAGFGNKIEGVLERGIRGYISPQMDGFVGR